VASLANQEALEGPQVHLEEEAPFKWAGLLAPIDLEGLGDPVDLGNQAEAAPPRRLSRRESSR